MKDQRFRYLTIKIDLIRNVKKAGNRMWEYKDKMFLVDIKENCGGIAFSVQKLSGNYGRDLRKVFREIQKELHLNK